MIEDVPIILPETIVCYIFMTTFCKFIHSSILIISLASRIFNCEIYPMYDRLLTPNFLLPCFVIVPRLVNLTLSSAKIEIIHFNRFWISKTVLITLRTLNRERPSK